MLLLRRNPLVIIEMVAAILLPLAGARFSPLSRTSVSVYWGQNSYGQSSSQQRLSSYCSNPDVDIISISFLSEINVPVVNFANAGDNCTFFPGTMLLSCPQIEEDIEICQATHGKTVMLSIGGATYTEGGFASGAAAISAANSVWAMFGPMQPGSGVKRPFGNAVVDGFDLDFESWTQNMAPFATQLRGLMDAGTTAGDKPYFLSAAPQCPYPDVANNDMLNGTVSFDFIQVQFYNNYCGVSSFVVGALPQPSYNLDTWDSWAKAISANPRVKILVGIPANTGAGAGYASGNILQAAIAYSKTLASFGGVMMWDMSQLYKNPGFLDGIVRYLDSGGDSSTTASATTPATTPTMTTTTLSTPSTTTPSTTPATTSTGAGLPVPEWGQCGGAGYTGPTACASPFTCVCQGTWWCHCQTATSGGSPGPSTASATLVARNTSLSQASTTTAPATPTMAVPEWGQCGGRGYTGQTRCASPLSCVCTGDWWCQCQPRPGQDDPTLAPAPVVGSGAVPEAVAQWGQCGGIGYSGPRTCAGPFSCACNSEWWCQCQ